MNSSDIRQRFIDYFVKNGHAFVESSSLVPHGDATLLFTNAGMNQFKNVFLGVEKRPYTRATTAQKCVRAGGKHNDLENVGWTARHHTFFEMLGNFSFGDYFKKEAIHFAWDFITNELKIPKDKLYVTVFKDDEEAARLWSEQEGVPPERIFRFGEKDNFWRMGDSGPCGPCSEIFYDLGPDVGGDPKENVMGGEGDRFMEIWNLVFMQYEDDGKGNLLPLPNPSIDTGMGLERLATVLQGQTSNYHTDVFMDLIHALEKVCGKKYDKNAGNSPDNVAFRVLADHARAVAFLIADGVMPSNEGRGYVLRRILRRAIRFGRRLSENRSLLLPAVEEVIGKMGGFYTELKAQQKLIEMTVKDEEARFLTTLDQGLRLLEEEFSKLKNSGSLLGGEQVFKLYDTFGFPVDLTRLIAQERGFRVDEAGFEKRVEAAKEQARKSWKGQALSGDEVFLKTWSQKIKDQNGATAFIGYDHLRTSEKILALADLKAETKTLKAGEEGFVVFRATPFYAEGGGQVGDQGRITSGQGHGEILDCVKKNDVFLHRVKVTEGRLSFGEEAELAVEVSGRRDTANNHSATHLLHAALREVLGTHVTQAGSLVEPDRLRFDFTHNKPLSAEEIAKIEERVNLEIASAHPVKAEVLPQKQALEKGALALFGEKYGEEVRVISMGTGSVEFCGGTHVANTAQILCFKIVSEGGVSAGIRRIEALTGRKALEYLNVLSTQALSARQSLHLPGAWTQLVEDTKNTALSGEISSGIEKLFQEIKDLKKEIQTLKGSQVDLSTLIKEAKEFQSGNLKGRWLFVDSPVDDRQVLSALSDQLRDKLAPSVVVLMGQGENTHPLLVSVSKELSSKIKAGDLLRDLASHLGGKGGGRPDFAQGAVPSRGNRQEIEKIITAKL
jgi:alanyl-tRNA synthetase